MVPFFLFLEVVSHYFHVTKTYHMMGFHSNATSNATSDANANTIATANVVRLEQPRQLAQPWNSNSGSNKNNKSNSKNTSKSKSNQDHTNRPPSNGKKNRKNQVSISHLMNFQSYRDTEEYQQSKHRERTKRRPSKNKQDGRRVELTGMRFLSVNFKFVVHERYTPQLLHSDPNLPIDLEKVIAVIAPLSTCPICISSDIIAPRMICAGGHVLCLLCCLRLMANDGHCPICFEYVRNLRPVIISDECFERPRVGEDVILKLMERQNQLATPVLESATASDFPDARDILTAPYFRFYKGDQQYLLDFFEMERMLVLAVDDEDKEMVPKGVQHIDQLLSQWTAPFNIDDQIMPLENDSAVAAKKFFYYTTGCNYFLSPFDFKVLKHSSGNQYELLPTSIVAKIEDIKVEVLDSDTIQHHKYLGHLPIGSQVSFIQCNWEGIIDSESWSLFGNDLQKRSKASKKKQLREEMNRKRALDNEEVKLKRFFMHGDDLSDLEYNDYDTGSYGRRRFIDTFDSLSLSNQTSPTDADIDGDAGTNGIEVDHGVAESDKGGKYETTVWGTRIKVHSDDDDGTDDLEKDGEELQEMILKAKEKRLKKSKKLVLMST